jgi:hypothetical protein
MMSDDKEGFIYIWYVAEFSNLGLIVLLVVPSSTSKCLLFNKSFYGAIMQKCK